MCLGDGASACVFVSYFSLQISLPSVDMFIRCVWMCLLMSAFMMYVPAHIFESVCILCVNECM